MVKCSANLLDPRLQSHKKPDPPNLGSLDDGESEWEYEYSTTETETFYVTLDLSKADFRSQEQSKSHTFTPRGPWPVQKASAMFLNRRHDATEASRNSAASSVASSDVERDDVEDNEDEGEDEDEYDGRPRTSSRQGQIKKKQRRPSTQDSEDDENRELERVQILDLHTLNPLVSYKGRVFSGAWAENTTTELLLTRRDDTDLTRPVLRHLDDDVDLLAASAARINVTEQKLRPKYSDRERQRASAHLPQTIIPPVDLKASQERIDQRNFLADLIALKRRKGATDDVTVIARSMQGKRAKAKTKGVRTHRRGRWAHSDRLQHHVRGLDERWRRGGRKKGSGRARGKWALFPLEEASRDSADAAASSAPDGESGVSTPTPFCWDDLEGGQEGLPARLEGRMEVDEEDEQDEDELGSEDNNDYEEDEDKDQGEMDEDED
ncbi:hypothetical protein GGR50DRAFT_1103 [Xylaria sp. CBS 124048]|nr:hypothetical protein GGR50DRAFT_1103 [Xylaria sp. CBS 124048]